MRPRSSRCRWTRCRWRATAMAETGSRSGPGGARRRIAVLAAAALTGLLTGCVSIPTRGPVVAGPQTGSDRVFELIADPPRAGAGPDQIVEGFLSAAPEFTDDHRVARTFLVPDRAAHWRPDASVAVYPGTSSIRVALARLDGEPVVSPDTTPAAARTATSPAARASAAGKTAARAAATSSPA